MGCCGLDWFGSASQSVRADHTGCYMSFAVNAVSGHARNNCSSIWRCLCSGKSFKMFVVIYQTAPHTRDVPEDGSPHT
jgi:hypothetical protein